MTQNVNQDATIQDVTLYQRDPKYIPRVAAVHDMCGYGKCSLTAAIPILSAAGCDVCPVPTALFSAHTRYRVFTMHDTTDILDGYLDAWRQENVDLDGVYSGFLGSADQVAIIKRLYREYPHALRLVDPVMGDGGEMYPTYTDQLCQAMGDLVDGADVLMPNLTEASFLLGIQTPESLTRAQAVDMLNALHEITPGDAVITSAALSDFPDSVCTIARDEQGAFAVIAPRLPGHFPGTGDVFTSVLTGALLSGQNLPQAVCRAAAFVSRCMRDTFSAGTPVREGVLLEQVLAHLNDAPSGMETVSIG